MLANFFFCIYYETVKPLRKKFSYLVAISLLTSHETYRFSMCLSNEGRKACILACKVSELYRSSFAEMKPILVSVLELNVHFTLHYI